MKNLSIIFILFLFLINLCCDSNDLESCNKLNKSELNKTYDFREGKKFLYYNCDCDFQLASEKYYDEIIELDISWRGIRQIIKIFNVSNFHIVQYFGFEDILNGNNKFKYKEKVLGIKQINKLKKETSNLKNLPKDVNPDENKIDIDLFHLFIKNKLDTISINGIMDFAKKDNEGKIISNPEKEKVMSFICKMLRLVEIKHGIKKYMIVKRNKNKIRFVTYIRNGELAKTVSYFIDGKEIKPNKMGFYFFELQDSDTLNLYNRLKVVETQWDGEVVEY